MKTSRSIVPQGLRCTVAVAMLLGAATAQAVVGPPADAGTFADYGNGGNVFQLDPMLYVQGLGNAGSPEAVVALNPSLQYSSLVSGLGTPLVTIDYQVRNTSATVGFGELRFMLFVNPDGDSLGYLDVLSETWGAPVAGDPVLREGREFSANPLDTILARFSVNNNLVEGPAAIDPACAAVAGCDATVGLQWNAPLIGPGETFQIRVGLSDDGQSLSSRWIDASAVDSPNTVLRLSGMSSIVPVPEPATALLLALGLAAGLATRSAAVRRRERR